MTTINDIYINAVLADSSYVDDLKPGQTGVALINRLSGRMTPAVAKYIGDNFTVVTQVSGLASSFDATVWRGNAGTPYAGQVYISMRGTQEVPDFLADGDLSTSGLAHEQLVDMVNWWLRETTPANQTAKQIAISTVSIPGLPRLQNFVAASSVQGTGNLLGISAIKSVDGHSLGGYLASAFVRLFGKGWPVESINTFNSAGFSRLATLNIENGFSQITQVIGAELGLSAFSGAQNNYFAENGINVTTNTWNPVGFKQYGTRTELFQEDLTPGLIDNHYMYKLTDLLALGNALAQLDQTLDLNKLSTLVSAGSNQMAASYEGVLDSIRKLLLGASVPSTQTGDANAGNAGPQPAARIEFQTNLAALQNAPAFQALASNVHIELATADLDTRAQNDFSALISLITLSPTVLTGSASLLEGVLGTAWNNEFAQWQADANLTAEQRAADQANFSDNYLADRATMLAWLVKANTEDKLTLDGSKYDSRDLKNWEFTDLTKNLTITVNGLLGFENPDPANKVIFGSDGNDGNITGGVAADALYGGAGVDTLDGGKDEDYLEGNAGADILTGGQDDDILSGGAGEDTYKFTSGDGRDTVLDSDGQGRIIIDADTLTGGQESTTGVGLWESTDKKYHYTRMSEADGSTTLTVLYGSKDRLFIKNFVDGMLGITLGVDTPVLPPPPAYTEALVDNYPSDDPIGRNYDRYYTNISMLITGTSNDDFIRTGSADDQIEGHGGHDNLVGRAGNDRIYADSRIDIAAAIEAAKESQPADPTASLLSGGSGEDLLIGRLSSNMMFGGGGSDTLIGGGDVDVIEGDGVDSDLGFGITVTKTFALDFDVDTQIYTHYCEQTLGDVITRYARLSGVASDGDGDADTIITGAGGDLVMADGGDDYLALGSGNDVGIGGAGSDIIDGGDDRDTLFGDFRWDAGPAPDGETEAQRYIRIGLDASEHGSDLIFGGAGGDYIEGNGRDDVIYGGSGSDRLLGDDLLTPGAWHGKDRIDGGAGDDTILGNGGDDILSGGADDDSVSGDDARTPGQYHGKDYLDGGDGADILWGDGNDDELIGGAGDDYLEGDYSTLEAIYHGKDFLSGGQGNDVLLGEGNDDVLHGGDDKDVLYGDALPDMALPAEANGSDILYGEAGDDELHGGGGNDLLIGGAGTDSLKGDDGDDSYRFAAGDSPTTALGENEWISDASGNNTVIFESAVADDLTLRSSNAGYYLAIDYSPGDRLLVQGGFAGAVATYEFADGERLSYTELIGRLFDGINNRTGADGQQIVTGGRDDNTLIVGSGNAILSGGRGNDTLITSGGGNTYLYNLGDGTDYIDDSSKSAGFMAANILRFGHGITAADLRLGLGSLRIQVGSDPANAIHIDGFAPDDVYAQPAIDRFEFADGSVLSYAQLLERGFDLTGDAGDNVITGTNINDRINGGAGSDTMTGGAGSDSYTWGAGSGQDVIDNTDATPDKTDTLLIDALLPSDLLLTRSGDDLLIRRRESSDQVTLLKHFTSAPIDVIAFADGSLWRGPEITAHVTNELTENADTYTGTAADDVIDGLAGNDTIRGLAGNDTISGGAGNDSLGGDNGDDLLLGDAGDDSLSGDDGNDILSGGAGTNTLQGGAGSDTLDARSAGSIDTLLGGPGSDTYLYGRGAGWDTIQETGSNPGDIDRLVMAPDIAPSDVLLARFTGGGVEYDHLQIGIKGSTNTISLHNYFTRQDDYYKIERIEFA
ncbi:calcium-binding protein, partial [Propionivibrio sp.]|uniref:calcium-binding protein n=1 Tax=Propionivibrio sp. TaxID=2212460 RepID=UPI0026398C7F